MYWLLIVTGVCLLKPWPDVVVLCPFLPSQQAMTSRRGDEDVLPLLSPKSRRRGSSPSFKAKGQSSHSKHRPYSAPGVRAESRLSQMSIEEDGDVSETIHAHNMYIYIVFLFFFFLDFFYIFFFLGCY